MRPIRSPWVKTYEHFVRSIRRRAIVVAPFITAEPLQQFVDFLDTERPPQISLLTNFAVDSLIQGSLDVTAIEEFCRAVPSTHVHHLPGLHAKVYVADNHTAIVTSGNLTHGSLYRNYEYGVRISDPDMVNRIAEDLHEYGSLGVVVSPDEISNLARAAATLRDQYIGTLESARTDLRQRLESQLESTRESLMELRGKPGESTNSIFARTIVYLLRSGPLSTREMHPLIQNIHPDLCDEGSDRVINGVRFGKEWKHRVRGAQVDLRRRGQIELIEGYWHLATGNDRS